MAIGEDEASIIRDLDELLSYAVTCKELKYVIDAGWKKRIQDIVTNWGPKRRFTDGGYNFYKILSDGSMTREELECRLCCIADIAKRQNKLRYYKDTRSKLKTQQNNQILGGLFEIKVLSDLIWSRSIVELYPTVGQTGKNIEARINIDNRWVYIEAKALGYSKFDPKGPGGSLSISSMMRQVCDALKSKLIEDSQLGLLSNTHPTVLCLSLGFYADRFTGGWTIEDFLLEQISNVSCVFMAESHFCQIGLRPFYNETSTISLTPTEVQFFEKAFRSKKYESYRACSA